MFALTVCDRKQRTRRATRLITAGFFQDVGLGASAERLRAQIEIIITEFRYAA